MADQKTVAPSTSSDSNLFGALCYIINVLVPFFVIVSDKKNDKFVLFHAYQALLLVALYMVLAVVDFVVTIVTSFIGGIGFVIGCLFMVVWLGVIVVILYAAYQAWLGNKYKLPIIGDMAEKFAK